MSQGKERKTRRGVVPHKANPFIYRGMEETNTEFVKLYPDGARALQYLNSPGTKVFQFLWREARQNKDNDRIFLSFSSVNQEATPIGRSTFMRGMTELIAQGFLAETQIQCWYWLNPHYIWNGDRGAFLKKHSKPQDLPTKEEPTP